MHIAVAGTVLIALYTDLKFRKIYNWLTFSSMGCALLWYAMQGSLSVAVLGLLSAGMLYFGLYLAGVLGAGDVKILMALGAWLGFKDVLQIGMGSILVGGLFAAFALIYERKFFDFMKRIFGALSALVRRKKFEGVNLNGVTLDRSHQLPFAVPIATTVLVYLVIKSGAQ